MVHSILRPRLQNPTLWMQVATVLAILGLSVLLPLIALRQQMLLLLGVLGLGVVCLVFVRLPELGPTALVVVGILVPSPPLPGGMNVAVLLLILLVGLWLGEILLRKPDRRRQTVRVVWPLACLVLVSILSFGIGQLPWFMSANKAPMDAQVGGLAVFMLAPAAFLLVGYRIRSERWLMLVTWTFVVIGTVHVLGWLLPPLGSLINPLYQPGSVNNSMFWVWLVAMALSQSLFNPRLGVGWRIALLAVSGATLFVAFVLNYDWKSGWVPAMVTAAAVIAARYLSLIPVLLFTGAAPALYLGARAIATDTYSYSTRLDAWSIVLTMVKTNPLTGFGPANYRFYAPLFPIRGYRIQFNSHNQYIDIIAQIGILGLLCIVWFFGEILWLGLCLRRSAPPGFMRAYVYGTVGGVVGTLVAGMFVDWYLPFVYNIGLTGFRTGVLAWLFMGGLVSIARMLEGEVESAKAGGSRLS